MPKNPKNYVPPLFIRDLSPECRKVLEEWGSARSRSMSGQARSILEAAVTAYRNKAAFIDVARL